VRKFFPIVIEYLPGGFVEDREIHKDMKTTTLITGVIAALTLFGVAPSAEARHKYSKSHVYVSGYRSCGTPIYTERYLIGHDRCGYPVWGYRTVQRYCPPPREYYRPPAVCPPPVVYPPAYPYYNSRPRSGVVISGAFRL
jgi:hypothetical protein